jgi:hypothetical protein
MKDAEHAGPAYENRQRTKPREKVRTAVPRSAYQRALEAFFVQPESERYGTKIAK